MSLLDEANIAHMSGRHDLSLALRQQAFQAEREAAEHHICAYENEPTRSILFRSAAALALACGDYGEAERLVALGLAGAPPAPIAQELHELQDQVNQSKLAATSVTT
jgi:hypothetical protein